jgi:hypothetical protein
MRARGQAHTIAASLLGIILLGCFSKHLDPIRPAAAAGHREVSEHVVTAGVEEHSLGKMEGHAVEALAGKGRDVYLHANGAQLAFLVRVDVWRATS